MPENHLACRTPARALMMNELSVPAGLTGIERTTDDETGGRITLVTVEMEYSGNPDFAMNMDTGRCASVDMQCRFLLAADMKIIHAPNLKRASVFAPC